MAILFYNTGPASNRDFVALELWQGRPRLVVDQVTLLTEFENRKQVPWEHRETVMLFHLFVRFKPRVNSSSPWDRDKKCVLSVCGVGMLINGM